jgi:hypothetical protein
MNEHAHQMLDQLDPTQLAAVTHLLEVLTDPVSRSLANAPFDAEPISAAEAAELDEAHAAIQRGEGITHEDMLREYGISR